MTRDMPTLHKGDIVTYSFDGYAIDGRPINPTIKRARTDVTWEDVVQNQEIVTPHVSGRYSLNLILLLLGVRSSNVSPTYEPSQTSSDLRGPCTLWTFANLRGRPQALVDPRELARGKSPKEGFVCEGQREFARVCEDPQGE
jgi:hypothetical protein